jgi:Cu2+-exporting ATPase
VLVATGAAAKRGILFRGGDVLEALGRVTVAAFDKTGTLTQGRPRVARLVPAGGDEAELVRLAAAAEEGSNHPLARAVVEEARRRKIPVGKGHGVVVHPGRGVEMHLGKDWLRVGNRGFLATAGVDVPATTAHGALTEIHVAKGAAYRGAILFEDSLRADAPAALNLIRGMGIRAVLLTGDRQGAGQRVAKQLDIEEVRAEQSPADKAAFIQAAVDGGQPTLMVGDGINDAPALSTATVGCVVAGGTDIALETSDLVLTRPDLTRIPAALALARHTLRVIHQNLFWAFAYNLLAIPVAAAGKLAPVYAALAMALSSICVLGNSLRLARSGEARSQKPALQPVLRGRPM